MPKQKKEKPILHETRCNLKATTGLDCFVVSYIRELRTKPFWSQEKENYVDALAKHGIELPSLTEDFTPKWDTLE